MIDAETISRISWQLASRRFCASQAAIALAVLACNARNFYPTRPQLTKQTRTAESAIRAACIKMIEQGQLVELPGRRLALADLAPAATSRDAQTHDFDNPPSEATLEPFAETPQASPAPTLAHTNEPRHPPPPVAATRQPAAATTQQAAPTTPRAREKAVLSSNEKQAAAKTAREAALLAAFASEVCKLDKANSAAAAALLKDYSAQAIGAALAQFAYAYTARGRLPSCRNPIGQIIAWSREPSRMDVLPAEAATLASFEQAKQNSQQRKAETEQAQGEAARNFALADAFMQRSQPERAAVIDAMHARRSPFANDAAMFKEYRHSNWRGLFLPHELEALAAALAAAEMLARSRTATSPQAA